MPSLDLHPDLKSAEKPVQFGQYRVVREIGTGGMARVFEGRHVELGSRVALKILRPNIAAQPVDAARFLREARAASQIRHQHVVEVFDVGTQDGVPYIVMEFLEGSDLATLLAEKGPLPLVSIVDVFLPVISAVATAHRAGVIHRDLKPANLMITRRPPRDGHAMVLDFGISKILSDDMEASFTRSESLLGTVQYLAPELTRGAKFASVASDQYAIGVMLYECATGQRPFCGGSSYETMHAIVTAPVNAPSQLVPALPQEFDAMVLRAMNRDPAKRFSSLHALGNALMSFGSEESWVHWAREFVEAEGTERDLWASAPATFRGEVGRARYSPGSDAALPFAQPRRAGWTRWAWPLVALGAVSSAIVLTRKREYPQVVPDVPPSDARLAEAPPPAPTEVATPLPIAESSAVAAPPVVPSIASAARESSRSPKPSGSKVIPAAKSSAPVGSSRAQPNFLLGTNEAPIVD
jgi:serine/threonine-protein kinase